MLGKLTVVFIGLLIGQAWCPICLAQEATYSFTGEVAEVYGTDSFIPLNSTVTGTFTLDYNAVGENPAAAFDFGTIGSNAYQISTFGGSFYGSPGNTVPLVFSSTAQVDGLSYATSTPGAGSASVLTAIFTVPDGMGGDTFNASENVQQSDTGSTNFSAFAIYNNGPLLPVAANGLPILAGNNINGTGGYFGAINQDGNFDYFVAYNFDSLTLTSYLPATTMVAAVPEPPALVMMLGGLLLLGAGWLRRPRPSRGELVPEKIR